MTEAVIVDAIRTPGGKRNGQFKDQHPVSLAAHVLKALEERNGLNPADVDDVIMGCVMQKTNLVIIKAIIAMGESLGMKIVAEGIETEEQYNIMKSYGAHEGQGFFFAPPVSQEEFEKLLTRGVL